MKTLREFWSFASDATKLSDAEMVEKGQENWSPLARVALETAANLIQDRALPDGEWEWAIEGALQEHPQAFEGLSLSIGAALEAMWRVVPEAKREEEARRAGWVSCSYCGPTPGGKHADGCKYSDAQREERNEKPADPVKYPSHLGQHAEDAMAYAIRPVSYLGRFSNLPETDPDKLREQMVANIQALRDRVVGMGTPQNSPVDWLRPSGTWQRCPNSGEVKETPFGKGGEVRASGPEPTPGNPVVRGSGFSRSIHYHPEDLMPPECVAHQFVDSKGGRYCLRCTRTYPNE